MNSPSSVSSASSTSSTSSLSDQDLLDRMPVLVRTERGATAEVLAHLVEIDRRRLFLGQACSSLFAYCTERLGYSKDEAHPRVRVAHVARRIPSLLDELQTGAIHLTGLYLLSKHLTVDNAEPLLAAARGKSRTQIECLIAEWFPRPDTPDQIRPLPTPGAGASPQSTRSGTSGDGTRSGSGDGTRSGTSGTLAGSPGHFRLEPLSPGRFRVEFTASAELADKIDRARELSSHALPSGDLAALFERALDQLIERETKRRFGSKKARRTQRTTAPGSRHVPVVVARRVWERDGGQCTFTDGHGQRCEERRFITLEHRQPYALGGPATVENLCLLCKNHNGHTARQVFGEEHIANKRAERELYAKVLRGLRGLGFGAKEARDALDRIKARGSEPSAEVLLRQALGLLAPAASA